MKDNSQQYLKRRFELNLEFSIMPRWSIYGAPKLTKETSLIFIELEKKLINIYMVNNHIIK